tara:strand:+ start:553 stop:846 length:294 start_codon:yes stop_codon:yes gene_type:complete
VKQANSVIKVCSIGDEEAYLGKCCMCQRRVNNDPDEFWTSETRLIGNKLFCGGCLLELHPVVEEVKYEYNTQETIANREGYFYSIDMATGRMVIDDS